MLGTQLSYALPLGVAGMLYTLQTDAHNYFVSHQLGPVVFAAYAVGCFDLQFTSILGEAVNSVLIPAVSLYEKQGESQRIIQLVGNAQRKLAAVFFPTAALLMVVAPEFISFLFTPRYLSAVPIFRINLILLPFNAFTLDALIRSYAQLRFLVVRVRVILFVLLCVALWRGIALYGAVGAISAVVVFSLLERGIIGTVAGRAAGVSRKDASLLKDVAKIAAAAGAAAVVTGLLKGWLPAWKPFPVLALCGAVYGSVYAGAAFALRIATPDEWDTARRSIASALAAAGIRRRPSI
jgi:O-antigen/teichoic acid export membrane protein